MGGCLPQCPGGIDQLIAEGHDPVLYPANTLEASANA